MMYKNLVLNKHKLYSFEATLNEQLKREHLVALKCFNTSDMEYIVTGNYCVEWDGDIPSVQIESVYLNSPIDNTKSLELTHKEIDYDVIANLIHEADDGYNWYLDRLEWEADWAYESYGDR